MTDLPSYSAWYEITLLACGPNKGKVIRLVRAYRGVSLFEAKCLVENLPQVELVAAWGLDVVGADVHALLEAALG